MSLLPGNMPDRRVCVLGMGFVGVTLSAVMAQIGFQISGVEIREDLVQRLNAGQAHFFEPGLTEQLTASVLAGRLRTSASISSDRNASVYIVTVGTPLGTDGRVDLSSITRISHQIAEVLKDGDMVVLRSTVKIGTTRDVVKPILDRSGRTYDLAFCPERTVEGQAMAELRVLPQIIGAVSFEAGLRAARLFQFVTPIVVRVSSLETAEMIKLVDNSARDLMFAYANEVAGMSEILGINGDEVIRSGRFGYSRVGLPKPGPVGGPCLSKDPHILCESMEVYGHDPVLTRAARGVNEALPGRVGRQIGALLSRSPVQPPSVAVLGVAFKGRPPTDDIRGTTVTLLLEGLREIVPNVELRAFDPVVPAKLIRSLGLTPVDDVENAFTRADAVVIHTDHPSFTQLQMTRLAGLMNTPGLVYDLWNLFSEQGLILPPGIRYLALGGASEDRVVSYSEIEARALDRQI